MDYANLDNAHRELPKPHGHKAKTKRRSSVRRFILFAVLFLFIFGVYNFAPLLLRFTKLFWATPEILYSVIANRDPSLKLTDGRVNFLLLGTAGGIHDGPDLSDTIIVASINVETGDAVLFSLPRDVYIEEAKSKINAIYAFGQKNDHGLERSKEVIGEHLGLPIHYGIRLDFAGFRKAVDQMGGIDVAVATAFDDYQYPLEGKESDTCGYVEQVELTGTASPTPSASVQSSLLLPAKTSPKPQTSVSASASPEARLVYINQTTGNKIYAEEVTVLNNPYRCRYEHVHFAKGVATMDGDTALTFVRSRKGTNGEGSDFARSKRQQAVILAFRQSLTSKETIFDLGKIESLVSTFGESIDTDVPVNELGDFYKLYKRVKQAQMRTIALTDGQDNGTGVFINPPPHEYGGQWVLIPKGNDWSIVQEVVKQNLVPSSPTTFP